MRMSECTKKGMQNTSRQLQDDEEGGLRLEKVKDSDNIPMMNAFQNLDFSFDCVHFKRRITRSANDFNSKFLQRHSMSRDLNLPIHSFANDLRE